MNNDIERAKWATDLLARDLIKIEIEYLRQIEGLSCYKNKVINALTHLYNFKNIDNGLERINDIYELEEKKLSLDIEYFSQFQIKEDVKHHSKITDSIEFAFDTYNEIVNFVSNRIYYVILYSEKHPDYEGYSLEGYFWDICSELEKELDLPPYLLTIVSKKEKEDQDRGSKIRSLERLSGFAWFKKKEEMYEKYDWGRKIDPNKILNYVKRLDKTNDEKCKDSEIETNDFDDLFKEYKEKAKNESETSKLARKYKDKNDRIRKELRQFALFDEDNLEFNSLNYVGFRTMFDDEATSFRYRDKATLPENWSEFVSNDVLKIILTQFPNLGISGKIDFVGETLTIDKTPNKFQDESGNIFNEQLDWKEPKLTNLVIKLSKFGAWNEDLNEPLERLLKALDVSPEQLTYIDGKPYIEI